MKKVRLYVNGKRKRDIYPENTAIEVFKYKTQDLIMKPSDRIKEILQSKSIYGSLNEAIVQYLDEQYEKQKPCEHKNKNWVSMIDAFICKDCKNII